MECKNVSISKISSSAYAAGIWMSFAVKKPSWSSAPNSRNTNNETALHSDWRTCLYSTGVLKRCAFWTWLLTTITTGCFTTGTSPTCLLKVFFLSFSKINACSSSFAHITCTSRKKPTFISVFPMSSSTTKPGSSTSQTPITWAGSLSLLTSLFRSKNSWIRPTMHLKMSTSPLYSSKKFSPTCLKLTFSYTLL